MKEPKIVQNDEAFGLSYLADKLLSWKYGSPFIKNNAFKSKAKILQEAESQACLSPTPRFLIRDLGTP